MTIRLASTHAATPVHRIHHHQLDVRTRSAAHRIRSGAHRPGVGAHRRSIVDRLHALPRSMARGVRGLPIVAGHERILPIGVGVVLVGAAIFSVNNVGEARGVVAEPEATPRLEIAGLAGDRISERQLEVELEAGTAVAVLPPGVGTTAVIDEPPTALPEPVLEAVLQKPIIVDTTLSDGKGLLGRYRVRSGDTLTGIADKFDVSMMTLWWANDLKRKDDLKVGQMLIIPPTSGLVVTVREGDTLESIARANKVPKDTIYEFNGLEAEGLVAGQVLIVPGARGEGIPIPKVKPRPRTTTRATTSGSSRSTRVSGTPRRYSGGPFLWPVSGGRIVQYYHYGHYGLDIDAPAGASVRASAGGTVIFAGWKNNGGGYQVWVAHGSGLYTTYNHMSGVSVGRGAHVGKGQRVGRIGCTGWCTGPHLHFEVWQGPIWNGGSRVNPLKYV
jgi:murein DD-endopeptidase MepM/ murein hydrolase activator NlpD